MTPTVAIKVIAEIITPRFGRSCWRRGQPDGVVCPQSGLSESGEGEDTPCGFEWRGCCQHKANRTRAPNSRTSDVRRRSLFVSVCWENISKPRIKR